ncbi:3'-5' exonuclease-like [Silene latifolia]|uniref:3'-5' exonuclease-like n=1 Tax=Silene latifolia TaxID=37657 RepID=UPI003D78272F
MAAPQTTTPSATITINDHFPNPNNNVYDVTFTTFNFSTTITTTVTADPATVTNWLTTLTTTTPQPRIIGLDVEWRPNRHVSHDNAVATLQLCTNNSCLIFHIIHCQGPIPRKLIEFLGDRMNTFVGTGIEADVERLLGDYGLTVAKTEDLGKLARRRGVTGLNPASSTIGLKELTRVLLGVEVQKPKSITMSRWDQEWLSYGQVQYACIDAYLSYESGCNHDCILSSANRAESCPLFMTDPYNESFQLASCVDTQHAAERAP